MAPSSERRATMPPPPVTCKSTRVAAHGEEHDAARLGPAGCRAVTPRAKVSGLELGGAQDPFQRFQLIARHGQQAWRMDSPLGVLKREWAVNSVSGPE